MARKEVCDLLVPFLKGKNLQLTFYDKGTVSTNRHLIAKQIKLKEEYLLITFRPMKYSLAWPCELAVWDANTVEFKDGKCLVKQLKGEVELEIIGDAE